MNLIYKYINVKTTTNNYNLQFLAIFTTWICAQEL